MRQNDYQMEFDKMSNLLTFDATIKEQNNLDKLCADRKLITEEIFKPNAYYGNDRIIKIYAGIPLSKPLKIIIPHGIVFSDDYLWEAEKKAWLPVIYNYSPHRYNVYSEKTGKIIICGAAPFVYLASLLSTHPCQASIRKGTIFFPSHSTSHVTVRTDYKNLCGKLLNLEDKYHPITICIYWRDYNLGHHEDFIKAGFKVYSAGHIYDPYFLFRFYHLCSQHQYSASNQTGSHLFYSVYAGCSFFFIDSENIEYVASEKIKNRDMSISHPETVFALKKLFSIPHEKSTNEQIGIVNEFLGVQYFKKHAELKKYLEFADKIDKFGFAWNPQTNRYDYRLPNIFPRKLLRKAKRYINKVL